jgi:ribosomal protein S18 acetylase RimI-like enzyme
VTQAAGITIRPMRDADRNAVIALWHECALTRPWNDPDRDIALVVATADADILVGEQNGRIVAGTMLGFDGHRGWIYYFAVAPDHRRTGIGRQLYDEAEAWMRARGVPKIQLMVRADNTQAIGFYRALGLEVQPVTTLGRRLDG